MRTALSAKGAQLGAKGGTSLPFAASSAQKSSTHLVVVRHFKRKPQLGEATHGR